MTAKNILIVITAAAVILCCLTGTVSARGVDNSIIIPGDIVYRGEQNLDFSGFSDGSNSVICLIQKDEHGSILGKIELDSSQKASVSDAIEQGTYYAYNSSMIKINNNNYCIVKELDVGKISVSPSPYVSGAEASPAEISKAAGIVFYISGSNLDTGDNKLNGSCNSFIVKNDDSAALLTEIVNLAGDTKSLSGIEKPWNSRNSEYAFRFTDQGNFISNTALSTKITVKFRIELNGLVKTTEYSFNAVQSEFSIGGATIETGETKSIALSGVQFGRHTVRLIDTGADTPYFIPGENIEIINNHEIIAIPGWNGTINIPVTVPYKTESGIYEIDASYDGRVFGSASIKVPNTKLNVTFDPAPSDAVKGLFSVGDEIKLSGLVKGATGTVDVYLYIKGPNLPENGANLDTLEAVKDGDISTFTVFTYSPILNKWEGKWSTSGYQAGVYTIYASLIPYGYIESSTPDGTSYGSFVSNDYSLSVGAQSLNLKSDETRNGYFTQGDEIKYSFEARGTPGSNGGSDGTVRWYIFGTNYAYTDMKKFQILEDLDELGKIAPEGASTIYYDRTFSYNLDPGTYSLVVQHPGPNTVFDVVPDSNKGVFSSVNSSGGMSFGIGALQTKNKAYALAELISGAQSDDLYVITDLVIEEPNIKIKQIENMAAGDELVIEGTTNYYSDDTFSLKINKLDFSNPDNNIEMIIPVTRGNPKSVEPYSKYMEREFKFDKIDTSTWFDGTYEARITNIDTGYESAMTFTVSGNKIKTDTSSKADYDTSLSSPAETYVPPITNAAYPTAAPVPTKSPGFIFVTPAIAAACVFIMLRRG